MAGPVEICNLALGWLGANLIHDLDADAPESTEAELCSANYDAAVKAVLEAKAWTFATERVDLGAGQESGVAEYPQAYAIPGEVVRVLAVDDGSGTFELGWVREGDQVLVERAVSSASAKAIVLVEDATKYPPSFVRALAYRLAADLAVPITENAKLALAMEQLYGFELKKAGALDGMQGSTKERKTSWLRNARGG